MTHKPIYLNQFKKNQIHDPPQNALDPVYHLNVKAPLTQQHFCRQHQAPPFPMRQGDLFSI